MFHGEAKRMFDFEERSFNSMASFVTVTLCENLPLDSVQIKVNSKTFLLLLSDSFTKVGAIEISEIVSHNEFQQYLWVCVSAVWVEFLFPFVLSFVAKSGTFLFYLICSLLYKHDQKQKLATDIRRVTKQEHMYSFSQSSNTFRVLFPPKAKFISDWNINKLARMVTLIRQFIM